MFIALDLKRSSTGCFAGQPLETSNPSMGAETDKLQSGHNAALEKGTAALDNWDPYLEAAAVAASHSTYSEAGTSADDVKTPAQVSSESSPKGVLELAVRASQKTEPLIDQGEAHGEEAVRGVDPPELRTLNGGQEAVVQEQTVPTLEMLVLQSVQEKVSLPLTTFHLPSAPHPSKCPSRSHFLALTWS